MKTLFLRRVGQFLMLPLAGLLVIEVALARLGNDYLDKRRYVETHADAIRTLILGHSQVVNAINPRLWGDSVYNFAMVGRPAHYDVRLAQRYLSRLSHLECVIWPMKYDIPLEDYNRELTPWKEQLLMKYEKYMGISYEPRIPWLHLSEVMSSNIFFTLRHPESRHEGYDTLGYLPKSAAARSPRWQQLEMPRNFTLATPGAQDILQMNLRLYQDLARACRDRGVRFVVITTPCYATYRAHMTAEGRALQRRCVEAMRQVYPAMEYYDFVDDPRFVDTDYYDAGHLSEEGAEKFTRILRDTLAAQAGT